MSAVRIKTNGGMYTTVKRIIIDEHGEPLVKTTSCCCASPGALGRVCARTTGNKTPCRCDCHYRKIRSKTK